MHTSYIYGFTHPIDPTIKASAAFQQRRQSTYLPIDTHRRAHARIYARIISLLFSPSRRNASQENLEIKQTTPDKRRARTCYVHLVTCSGKLGAARLVPLSPPFPFPPHSRSPATTLFSSAARIHDTFGGATANGNNVAVLRSSASSRELYQL